MLKPADEVSLLPSSLVKDVGTAGQNNDISNCKPQGMRSLLDSIMFPGLMDVKHKLLNMVDYIFLYGKPIHGLREILRVGIQVGVLKKDKRLADHYWIHSVDTIPSYHIFCDFREGDISKNKIKVYIVSLRSPLNHCDYLHRGDINKPGDRNSAQRRCCI